MTNHDDPGLTEEQKRSQDLFDMAWARAQKQAIDLQRGSWPLLNWTDSNVRVRPKADIVRAGN